MRRTWQRPSEPRDSFASGFKLRYFESNAPILVVFLFDLAIGFEHLWTLYCLRAMHASCMRRLSESKYADANTPEHSCSKSKRELDRVVSKQIDSVRRSNVRASSQERKRPSWHAVGAAVKWSTSASRRVANRNSGFLTRKLSQFHSYMKDLGEEEAATSGLTNRETRMLYKVLAEDRPLAEATRAAFGLTRNSAVSESSGIGIKIHPGAIQILPSVAHSCEGEAAASMA